MFPTLFPQARRTLTLVEELRPATFRMWPWHKSLKYFFWTHALYGPNGQYLFNKPKRPKQTPIPLATANALSKCQFKKNVYNHLTKLNLSAWVPTTLCFHWQTATAQPIVASASNCHRSYSFNHSKLAGLINLHWKSNCANPHNCVFNTLQCQPIFPWYQNVNKNYQRSQFVPACLWNSCSCKFP
jgi:hypothetical protein